MMVEKNAAVTSLPTGRMVIVGALTASLYWSRTRLGVSVGGKQSYHNVIYGNIISDGMNGNLLMFSHRIN